MISRGKVIFQRYSTSQNYKQRPSAPNQLVQSCRLTPENTRNTISGWGYCCILSAGSCPESSPNKRKPRAPITRIWGTRGGHGGECSTRTFRRGVRRCLGRTAFLLPDHVAEAGKRLIQTADPVDQSQLYCLTSLQHGTDIVGNLVGA